MVTRVSLFESEDEDDDKEHIKVNQEYAKRLEVSIRGAQACQPASQLSFCTP